MPDALPLSTVEAAQIIGCSVSSISRFVKDGLLQPIARLGGGPGGAMFFAPEDVEALRSTRKAAS